MSDFVSLLVALQSAALAASALAALVTLTRTRKTLRFKKTLAKVALSDKLVAAELVKFYRDRELSDAEVRAVVRAIERAIEKDLVGATDELKLRLKGARALAVDEIQTRGHRLFKELAAEASDSISHAA